MITKLVITKVNPKPFKGDDGTDIMYFWYTALREDGVTIQFGSMNEYVENERVEIELLKTENKQGRIMYKEVRI